MQRLTWRQNDIYWTAIIAHHDFLIEKVAQNLYILFLYPNKGDVFIRLGGFRAISHAQRAAQDLLPFLKTPEKGKL